MPKSIDMPLSPSVRMGKSKNSVNKCSKVITIENKMKHFKGTSNWDNILPAV